MKLNEYYSMCMTFVFYFLENVSPSWWKSHHSSELNYIFGSPFTNLNTDLGGTQTYTDEDRQMSLQVMKLWTNFAKYG